MSKNRLKAAIFDLDGTLLDSMGVWFQVDRNFLLRRGIEMPADYSHTIAPMGFPLAAKYTKERFSLPETEGEIMTEWHEMAVSAYANDVPAKPHAIEYLHHLISNGIPVAAATASQPEFYIPALRRLSMLDLFSSVTEISEVARGKGHPDVYLRAAERLGMHPHDCAVFEDIPAGILGAKAGGFFTVSVYDPHCKSTEEMKQMADMHIDSFAELLANDIF